MAFLISNLCATDRRFRGSIVKLAEIHPEQPMIKLFQVILEQDLIHNKSLTCYETNHPG